MIDFTLALLIGLGALALACTAAAYFVYWRQQVSETVDPVAAGWLVSFLNLTFNCIAQLRMGDGWSWGLVTVIAQAVGSLVILWTCHSKGRLHFKPLEVVAVCISVAALIIALLYQAELGTVMTLVANAIGMAMIIHRAARVYGAEHPLAWVINLGAAPPTILAAYLSGDDRMLLVTPVHLLTVDLLVIVAIYTTRWKLPAESSDSQSSKLVTAQAM